MVALNFKKLVLNNSSNWLNNYFKKYLRTYTNESNELKIIYKISLLWFKLYTLLPYSLNLTTNQKCKADVKFYLII